jgi:hypothetical protein
VVANKLVYAAKNLDCAALIFQTKMRAKRLLAVVAGTGDDDHESSVKVGVQLEYNKSTSLDPALAQNENNRKTTARILEDTVTFQICAQHLLTLAQHSNS